MMKLGTKAQKALDKVVEKFKSGDLGPIIEITRLKRETAVPFDSWSFSNRVLAYIQSGGSTDLRGYKQWQRAGRQVKKGACASYILAPRLVTIEDEETGEKTKELRGFLSIPVFAESQTEGEPLPECNWEPSSLPPLADVARKLNIKVSWKPLLGRLGDCDLEGTEINIGSHDPAVFFHELAHAAHARLNGGSLKSGQRADQETTAEFTAAVLSELYGFTDHTGNAWQYISELSRDPLVCILRALGTVEKVLSLLCQEI